jgi:hypothetical protein
MIQGRGLAQVWQFVASLRGFFDLERGVRQVYLRAITSVGV